MIIMGNTVVIMNHKSYDKYEIYYLGTSNIQSHENWRHTKYILNRKLLLYLYHAYYSIPCFSKKSDSLFQVAGVLVVTRSYSLTAQAAAHSTHTEKMADKT